MCAQLLSSGKELTIIGYVMLLSLEVTPPIGVIPGHANLSQLTGPYRYLQLEPQSSEAAADSRVQLMKV